MGKKITYPECKKLISVTIMIFMDTHLITIFLTGRNSRVKKTKKKLFLCCPCYVEKRLCFWITALLFRFWAWMPKCFIYHTSCAFTWNTMKSLFLGSQPAPCLYNLYMAFNISKIKWCFTTGNDYKHKVESRWKLISYSVTMFSKLHPSAFPDFSKASTIFVRHFLIVIPGIPM